MNFGTHKNLVLCTILSAIEQQRKSLFLMTHEKVWQLSLIGLDGLYWLGSNTMPYTKHGDQGQCRALVVSGLGNMNGKKSPSLFQEKPGCYQQKKNSKCIISTQVCFPDAQSLLQSSSCVDHQADVDIHCGPVGVPAGVTGRLPCLIGRCYLILFSI